MPLVVAGLHLLTGFGGQRFEIHQTRFNRLDAGLNVAAAPGGRQFTVGALEPFLEFGVDSKTISRILRVYVSSLFRRLNALGS